MSNNPAKEFEKILTPEVKKKLLVYFNSLYPCSVLSAYEYKIVYSAYLKKNGKLPPPQHFYLASELFTFEIDPNDNESSKEEVTEEEFPEGALLAIMNDSYDLDKIIEIISHT
jgi:hypothetical protein